MVEPLALPSAEPANVRRVNLTADAASGADYVSVIVALIALVISLASLWLTSLRRANVELDLLHDGGTIQAGGMAEGRPTGPHIDARVFVANTGASGTVVTRLDATDFREENTATPIWSGIARIDMTIGRPVALPLERDDAETVAVAVHLQWNPNPPASNADEFARRLHTLRSVTVTLRWEWRRAKFPNVRQRETAHGTQVVTIAADRFRAMLVKDWRASGITAHLADVAEGRQP